VKWPDNINYEMRKTLWLLIFGVCVSASSCDGPKTTWSAESRSPDGKMVVQARTIEPSGIGTGDIGTFVYLNWTSGSQSPTIILAFSDGSDKPGDKSVGVKWLSPSHLELTYKGPRTIDFQAVKAHSIDITVRELASSAGQ
jgi:hypothetical protein